MDVNITKPDHKSICTLIKKIVNEGDLDYPRDCKNFTKLWNNFSDWEFWSKHFRPYEGRYAIHAYLGSKGQEFIKKQWNLFLLEKEKVEKESQNCYNINKEPIERVILEKRKPRTIKEFLKYNYESKEQNGKTN